LAMPAASYGLGGATPHTEPTPAEAYALLDPDESDAFDKLLIAYASR